jgi:hypothetical protein
VVSTQSTTRYSVSVFFFFFFYIIYDCADKSLLDSTVVDAGEGGWVPAELGYAYADIANCGRAIGINDGGT